MGSTCNSFREGISGRSHLTDSNHRSPSSSGPDLTGETTNDRPSGTKRTKEFGQRSRNITSCNHHGWDDCTIPLYYLIVYITRIVSYTRLSTIVSNSINKNNNNDNGSVSRDCEDCEDKREDNLSGNEGRLVQKFSTETLASSFWIMKSLSGCRPEDKCPGYFETPIMT